MNTYSLNAANGTINFTLSPSGKTVVIDVHKENYLVKSKRLRVVKARTLYLSLLKKGYKALVVD